MAMITSVRLCDEEKRAMREDAILRDMIDKIQSYDGKYSWYDMFDMLGQSIDIASCQMTYVVNVNKSEYEKRKKKHMTLTKKRANKRANH